MKTLLTISFTCLTIIVFGQNKAKGELTRFLKSNQVDTFIIVKSGCSGCIISYEDTDKIKNRDTITISLLYQKKGKQTLMTFSDTGQTKIITDVETNIFHVIASNQKVLLTKHKYYREQKLWNFQPPPFATFPYETIEIKYGQFRYEHTLVERETDDCGTVLKNENWFKVEVDILKTIDKLKT